MCWLELVPAGETDHTQTADSQHNDATQLAPRLQTDAHTSSDVRGTGVVALATGGDLEMANEPILTGKICEVNNFASETAKAEK